MIFVWQWFLMRCMAQGSELCHYSLWRSREAIEEKIAAFILTMALWRWDPGQHTALVCSWWFWLSVHVEGAPAFVSDVNYHYVFCFFVFCVFFYLILEVGHRDRSEGGCLKTGYDDSFTPHICVKKLDLCEHISPCVMTFMCSRQ